MKLQRFYVEDINLNEELIVLKDKELLNQILNVFRMSEGSTFLLFNNEVQVSVLIKAVEKNVLTLEKIEVVPGIERKNNITLAQALIKRDNFDLILQKCTELGVSSFVPLITERCTVKSQNTERAMKILSEATEQSGFATVPLLSQEVTLKSFLKNLSDEEKKNIIVLDFGGVDIRKNIGNTNTIILIGPEGGFSDNEKEMFKEMNIKVCSIGGQTLRAETAAIVASTLIAL